MIWDCRFLQVHEYVHGAVSQTEEEEKKKKGQWCMLCYGMGYGGKKGAMTFEAQGPACAAARQSMDHASLISLTYISNHTLRRQSSLFPGPQRQITTYMITSHLISSGIDIWPYDGRERGTYAEVTNCPGGIWGFLFWEGRQCLRAMLSITFFSFQRDFYLISWSTS